MRFYSNSLNMIFKYVDSYRHIQVVSRKYDYQYNKSVLLHDLSSTTFSQKYLLHELFATITTPRYLFHDLSSTVANPPRSVLLSPFSYLSLPRSLFHDLPSTITTTPRSVLPGRSVLRIRTAIGWCSCGSTTRRSRAASASPVTTPPGWRRCTAPPRSRCRESL